MDTTIWPAAATALTLLATVAGWTALRRRPRPDTEVEDRLPAPETAATSALSGSDLDQPGAPDESVELRALRVQVRSLEETLEQAPDLSRATIVLTRADDEDSVAAYRRQVRLTIQALARRTADGESPHRTLARMVAAMQWLEAPEALTRPALPLLDVTPAAPQVTAPMATYAPLALPEVGEVASMAAPVETDGIAPAPRVSEVVLPVPPPAPSPPKRGRRRLRHQAA